MDLRYLLLIVLLHGFFCAAKELTTEVPVIAIEYPPYTSEQLEGFGLSFVALKRQLAPLALQMEPVFLPPPRAGKEITSGDWCFSFYPPPNSLGSHQQIMLDKKPIMLSFFRKSQQKTFSWGSLAELAGLRVALLRSYNKGGIHQELKHAGLAIFEVNDLSQGFALLAKDRVDLVFADSFGGEYQLAKLGLEKNAFQFAETALSETYLHVWVNLNCAAAKRFAAAQ